MQDSEQIKLKASREQKKDLCPCKPTSEFTDADPSDFLRSLFTIPFKQGNFNDGNGTAYQRSSLQGSTRRFVGDSKAIYQI